MVKTMPTHSVYALCEPDTGNVRYIGKTSTNLPLRLAQHVVGAFQTPESERLVVQWVLELAENGKYPKIVLIEECDRSIVSSREADHIRQYAKSCDLLNLAGIGGKLTPGNIKMIGVPLALHERLRAEAKAERVAIFEIIEDAMIARDKLADIAKTVAGDGIDANN